MVIPELNNVPKRGFLKYRNSEWSFIPGTTRKKKAIPLPQFSQSAESLLQDKKLFQGWKSKRTVATARKVQTTANILANLIHCRKVSAATLHHMQAPSSLKQHLNMTDNDKSIWDESYRQEYQGLVDIGTWETITEEEYQLLKPTCKGLLPTMAIAIIKYDGNGNPIRAKYRIVALGNLDPNSWSKNDCFAPVLSQMELRFLVALAVKKQRIPKTGDVAQAFCQSFLPDGENYVCKPPNNCPLTPQGVYLKLKKTLYGLRRSPKHFYDLAKKTLEAVGLKPHPSSPCLFSGVLIKGQPPLYLGLYVDDFIYFSESDEVELKFEKDFGALLDTDFNNKIGYFLGVKFTTKRTNDGNVHILMTQEPFIENLCQIAELDSPAVNEPKTPYCSGHPVDNVPKATDLHTPEGYKRIALMRTLVGSLNWLSLSTRPDISTITNMCAKYMACPNKGHINQVKRIIRYLKGTKTKGISFSSKTNSKLEAFVKFPIPNKVVSLCDANWGPQDQSVPNPGSSIQVDLFKNRSVSGFLIWLGGPLHWVSKRQSITARSSTESEIYATDECTKCLLHLAQIVQGFDLIDEIMAPPTKVYNDNAACVQWAHAMATKGLRHIQIRDSAVRESVQSKFIDIEHVEGKVNLSDMFTKEEKNAEHFIVIRDFVLTDSNDF
jgi:hypothetical protein